MGNCTVSSIAVQEFDDSTGRVFSELQLIKILDLTGSHCCILSVVMPPQAFPKAYLTFGHVLLLS